MQLLVGRRMSDCFVEENMIEVTRLNGTKLIVNAEMIEFVEETPDTVISLLDGKKIIVKESRQDIKNLVILYKREFMAANHLS